LINISSGFCTSGPLIFELNEPAVGRVYIHYIHRLMYDTETTSSNCTQVMEIMNTHSLSLGFLLVLKVEVWKVDSTTHTHSFHDLDALTAIIFASETVLKYMEQ
jgi:hypothetical protein